MTRHGEGGGSSGGAGRRDAGASFRVLETEEGLRCAVAGNAGPMTLDGTRNYLVGRREAVLLDPGPADGEQERRIAALVGDRGVVAVCLTHAHPDHADGAAHLARRLDAELTASGATLERLEARGRPLEDGDAVEVDGGDRQLRALETPGHAADHLAFLLVPGRSLFTGDLVLGRGSAMVGHPDGHVGDYLASLERLARLRPARLHPGHGPAVEDPADRLEAYRRHRLEREEQIREAVEDGAAGVPEIRRRVYGPLPDGLEWAAEASIRAHLVHIEERGGELPPLRGREDEVDRGH